MLIDEVIDELRSFNVPDECIERIITKLLLAGETSVFASLGEIVGVRCLNEHQLAMMVSWLIANSEEQIDVAEPTMDPSTYVHQRLSNSMAGKAAN